MKYSKQDKEYMQKLKEAFADMQEIPFRELKMSKDRFSQLSNTYEKISDSEELKDFAFISTHPYVRDYYISSCGNLLLSEKLSLLTKEISSIKETSFTENLVGSINCISNSIQRIYDFLLFNKCKLEIRHIIKIKPSLTVHLYLSIISLSLLVVAICLAVKSVYP